MHNQRKTKIICTIGPASESQEMIEKLIEAGMDVARLNFSHGTHAAHAQVIERIRIAGKKLDKHIGILQDLSGPKIRLGSLPEPVTLAHGSEVTFVAGETATDGAVPVNYPYLAEDVNPGARILLADGLVELEVLRIEGSKVVCRVINDGIVSSHKGVNLPLTKLRIPAFTDKDREDLAFGIAQGVNYVAMSFVRSVEDLTPVRAMLSDRTAGHKAPMLLAKLEKPEAIEQFDDILSYVDGTMVARGDLGVEMPLERLPAVQKRILSATRRAAKPTICATQMLRSMIDNPRPTRAEVTDCANAILDGASAVMLSEETAVGAYPVEAVKVLDKVALATEPTIDSHRMLDEPDAAFLPPIESSLTREACRLAERLGATLIAVVTHSGASARQVARFRQQIPIIALTSEEDTLHKMPLSWGITPVLEQVKKKPSELGDVAVKFALEHDLVSSGDRVVFTCGYPSMEPGSTDTIKILTVP